MIWSLIIAAVLATAITNKIFPDRPEPEPIVGMTTGQAMFLLLAVTAVCLWLWR